MVVPNGREYDTGDHQELAGGEPSRSKKNGMRFLRGFLAPYLQVGKLRLSGMLLPKGMQ